MENSPPAAASPETPATGCAEAVGTPQDTLEIERINTIQYQKITGSADKMISLRLVVAMFNIFLSKEKVHFLRGVLVGKLADLRIKISSS